MKPIVIARRCAVDATDERIAATLSEMLDGIDRLAERVGRAGHIAVKSNIGIMEVRIHRGRQIALTDAAVVEGVIAWLRRHTEATIVVGDATTDVRCEAVAEAIGLTERLARHGARIVDFNDPPYATLPVPDGGIMFREYALSEAVARADLVVSIAKMKSHLAAGATLTLKNLFGIPPTSVYGAPRRYLHAPIRLPRTIADLGLLLKPGLCVVDGLVGQTQREWGGPPIEAGWLVAGNNTVATDAVTMTLMGIDPAADYPTSPYHFDRNPVLLAAEHGLGPVALDTIDLRGDPLAPVDGFFSDRHMEPDLLDAIRRSIAEQAALFDAERDRFFETYPYEVIGLYDGEVIHHGTDLDNLKSRGQIARERGRRDRGLYLKRVTPREEEIEMLSVYEALLRGARA